MILDTNNDLFPQGTYRFRVADVPVETEIRGYKAWQWTFEVETDEGYRAYNERIMQWNLAPLVRALGGFEEFAPGKFKFEPTAALNRMCKATIKHITLEKGASAGKTVARMDDIQAVGGSPVNRGALAAQAPAGHSDEDIPF